MAATLRNPSQQLASVPSDDRAMQATLMDAYQRACASQPGWAGTSLRERLARVRLLRHQLVVQQDLLCSEIEPSGRAPVNEVLVSQIFPLVEACRFLEREAAEWLKPRRLRRWNRPLWLVGCHTTLSRDPLGVILILAASNYPLLLPGVQALQALVAGNSVLWKPGRGGRPAAEAMKRLLVKAGFEADLIQILPESDEAGRRACSLPVNKVFLTGSASTGRDLLHALAARLVPATVELSGCDAMVVREDADLGLVVRALRFGLLFNRGATCIAPRRIFVHRTLSSKLITRLALAFEKSALFDLAPEVSERMRRLVTEARASGAGVVAGGWNSLGKFCGPLVVSGARPEMALLQEAFFAPLVSVVSVEGDDEAVRGVHQCCYALGASVFSRSSSGAAALAARLRVGVVTVNDVIVPTADPRIPFGGRGESGFGVTRGGEGLQEMTALKAISTRRGTLHPHLNPQTERDHQLLRLLLVVLHGSGLRSRLFAVAQFVACALRARLPSLHGDHSAKPLS